MKITQINNDQLQIDSNGISSVIVGIVFALAGVGVAFAPLYAENAHWWVSLIGGAFIAVGAYMAFTAKNEHIVLIKHGTSTKTVTKVIGGSSGAMNFESADITSVVLNTHTEYVQDDDDRGTGKRRERVSVLSLAMKDYSEIVLGSDRSGQDGITIAGISLSSLGKAPLSAEALYLSEFFGVPLTSSSQDPIGIDKISQAIGQMTGGLVQPSEPLPPTAMPQLPIQPVTAVPPIQPPQPIQSAGAQRPPIK